VTLSRGPRENRHRPSIDVLFRSAARSHGSRVWGIVLSGELDDGSAGLMAIGMKGGVRVVQDPAEALSPDMPNRAIQYAGADYILPVAEIANLLGRIHRGEELPAEHPVREVRMQDHIDKEVREAEMENIPCKKQPGKSSEFACPECHGVLWELDENGLLRFRCRVGHAFTADALRVAMSEAGENALWAAMRALEEKIALLRRMSSRAEGKFANRYREDAEANSTYVETIRKILIENQKAPKAEPEAA
jgi:two-component system, chemotaxis family, protein-glutamate methylesterase/glutaminase